MRRVSDATLFRLCDPKTRLLLSGYLRSCESKTPQSAECLQLMCLRYYFIEYFCPEKFISTNETNTTRVISSTDSTFSTLGSELKHQIYNCRSGDTIHLYPGKYAFDHILFDQPVTPKSIRIIGIGEGVILNGRIKAFQTCNVHFQNVTLSSRGLDNANDENDMPPKLVDIGEWMRYDRKKINLFFSDCIFKYDEWWCISVDEYCGLYLMNCVFEGETGAGSAISANPCYTDMNVIGCTFNGCARSYRPYLDWEKQSFYQSLRPCIEILTHGISLFKRMKRAGRVTGKVCAVGNRFYKNAGPLIQMEMAVKYDIKLFVADNKADDAENDANAVNFINQYEWS